MLKDATRADVSEQLELHRSYAAANALKARWFSSILKALPPEKTVGEVLTEGELARMYDDASSSG